MPSEEALEALKPEENWELETIAGLFPKKVRYNETKNELDEIKEWEEKFKRKDLNYRLDIKMIFNNTKL